MKPQHLDQFAHTTADPWRWRAAQIADIQAMCNLLGPWAEQATHEFHEFNVVELSRNLAHLILDQMYDPKRRLASVAVLTDSDEIVAVNLATRDVRPMWSLDEQVIPLMLAVEPTLTSRIRVALTLQAMTMWERWAHVGKIPVINSGTIREPMTAFMRLHEAMGYTVRGTAAFKRMNTVTFELDAARPESARIVLP